MPILQIIETAIRAVVAPWNTEDLDRYDEIIDLVIRGRRRARKQVDDELLRDVVVPAYSGGGVREVMRVTGRTKRTAQKYVQRARERGFLDSSRADRPPHSP